MDEIFIPHTLRAWIDRRSEVPREILVVVTRLPEHSTAGPEADDRHEMWVAIAIAKAKYGLHCERITWGANA